MRVGIAGILVCAVLPSGTATAATKLTPAEIQSTFFDGAEFCENVDFTEADLLRTNFRRAIISAAHVPVFARTPWWLATGLGFDEISLLDSRYRRATSVAEYPR